MADPLGVFSLRPSGREGGFVPVLYGSDVIVEPYRFPL
jgi:hypothetical protein